MGQHVHRNDEAEEIAQSAQREEVCKRHDGDTVAILTKILMILHVLWIRII